MEEIFVCPICGNDDPKYFGYRNGKIYCRKCISFQGQEVKGDESYPTSVNYYLEYNLSKEQEELSNTLVSNYKNGINTLVHAVCGSGKTEIVLEVIRYAVSCGDRVGFAIPRRDVVIEIHERIQSIFKDNTVISVYGGHNDILEGDIVVLTTHQLFRYCNYFDLLIIDEIDAFPFRGNDLLDAFFHRSIKNKYIMMSATPYPNIIEMFSKQGYQIVELFSRFHKHPLPVPVIKIGKAFIKYTILYDEVKRFIKNNKKIFIFAPTIEICEEIYSFLSLLIKGGEYVHSKRKDRSEIISNFKQCKYRYLVTTAVLERGVTFKDLQVIVFKADHAVYDSHALIQIAGRVGRKKDAPDGEVIYIANKANNEMLKSISEIKRANASLQNMFQRDKTE